MSNYGEILREARKRAGFRQKKVAEMTGLNQTLLSVYERGEVIVKPDRLEALAKVYGDNFLWQRYMRAAYPSYAAHHPEMVVDEKHVTRFFAEDQFGSLTTVYHNELAKKATRTELARKIADQMIQDGVMVIDEQEADGKCRITATVYAVEGA